jgi:hypothetical protein
MEAWEKFSSRKKLEIPEYIVFKTVKIVFILLFRISLYDFNKTEQMVLYISEGHVTTVRTLTLPSSQN